MCSDVIDMSIQLSIIIPVYNAETYLGRCLDSIVQNVVGMTDLSTKDETLAPSDNGIESSRNTTVEVIAVDDGSSDRSYAVMSEYASKYGFITAIHQENSGPAAARNAGLRISCGDWVWFIDPDDYADEDALDAIFSVLSPVDGGQTSAAPDVVIFDAYEHTGTNGSDEKISVWEHFGESCSFSSEVDICVLQRAVLYPREIGALAWSRPDACSCDAHGSKVNIPRRIVPLAAPWDKIYRRIFLTENRLTYNEELRVLDDMYFNMEVFGCAKRIDYVKKPIYHYIRNEGSITSSYTQDRVSLDLVVWEAIDRYLESQEASEQLRQAYYKRIIRSYAICCKRSIFHPDNPMHRSDQVRLAARVMRLPEYDVAFRNVRLSGLEWMLKPVAILGRLKYGAGMWLLNRLERAHV